jgi:hypothetical protein
VTGVPLDLLRSRDFAMVGFDLIDRLDSLEAAVLLSRIAYRAGTEGGWWEVTKAEMQGECRLSEWKVDQALALLIKMGYIEWVRIRPDDNRRKVRPVVEGVGRKPPEGREETSSTPSSKKVITTPPSDDGDETVQSTESRARTPRLTIAQTAAFDDWWNEWPYKVDKGAARKAYAKALKITDASCLLSGLLAQVETLREAMKPDPVNKKVYCPYPATWLNGERWNDEVTPRIVLPDRSDHHAWRERQPGESKIEWQTRVYGVEG